METAVITFGRINPPTIGHQKLVDKVKQIASEVSGVPMVFLSHTQDNKSNPLDYNAKYFFARKAFGDVVKYSEHRTIFDVLKELQDCYDKVILVVGSDRVSDFETILDKYNGKDYDFGSVDVVSAGQRDELSDEIDGVSGTKMRAYALSNNVDAFRSYLPDNVKMHTDHIMNLVRKGMNHE